MVGVQKGGLPRLETHHWSRARVAHLRPGQVLAERPQLGRRKTDASGRTELQTSTEQAPNSNQTNAHYATYDSTPITQPHQPSDLNGQNPAARAGVGRNNNIFPPSHHITGPPPVPFSQQQTSSSANDIFASPVHRSNNYPGLGRNTNLGTSHGDNYLGPNLSERNTGLSPNVNSERNTGLGPSVNNLGTASNTEPGVNIPTPPGHTQVPSSDVLIDHDYTRQHSAVSDHNYFTRPPPGFTFPPQHGRPSRNVKIPSRYNDYDLS